MSATEGRPEGRDPRPGRDPLNIPGSGWVPTSPAIGFPVYGLDGSWPGTRWLDSFGDQIGDPPRWVTLGHQSADGESLILVATYSRPATDEMAAQRREPPLKDAAFRAAHIVHGVTLPAQSVSRPDGFLRVLVAHALEMAEAPWQRRQHWHADQLRLMRG